MSSIYLFIFEVFCHANPFRSKEFHKALEKGQSRDGGGEKDEFYAFYTFQLAAERHKWL